MTYKQNVLFNKTKLKSKPVSSQAPRVESLQHYNTLVTNVLVVGP